MMTPTTFDDAFTALNGCKSLFARDVREVSELMLRIRLVEARAQNKVAVPPPWATEDVAAIFKDARPVEPDETSLVFEIVFKPETIVSYVVLNESCGCYPKPPEVFTGKLFREFQKSHLLDFIRANTCASDEYPGKLRHFEIVSENEVFDIIATAAPEIVHGQWRQVQGQPDW